MASKIFAFMAAGILGFAFFAICTVADDRPRTDNVADRVLRELQRPGHGDASAAGDGNSRAWGSGQTVLASRLDDRQTDTGLRGDGGEHADTHMFVHMYSGSKLSTQINRLQDAYISDDRPSRPLEGRDAVSPAHQVQRLGQTGAEAAELAIADGGNTDGSERSGGAFRSLLHACHSRRCAHKLPTCPRCRFPRSQVAGHCRTTKKIFNCERSIPSRKGGPPPKDIGHEGDEGDEGDEGTSTSTTSRRASGRTASLATGSSVPRTSAVPTTTRRSSSTARSADLSSRTFGRRSAGPGTATTRRRSSTLAPRTGSAPSRSSSSSFTPRTASSSTRRLGVPASAAGSEVDGGEDENYGFTYEDEAGAYVTVQYYSTSYDIEGYES